MLQPVQMWRSLSLTSSMTRFGISFFFVFALASVTVPSGAATTSVLLLALALTVPLRAQHLETAQTVVAPPRSKLEREVQGALICMCGTCGRQLVDECACGYAAEMRNEVSDLVGRGMTKDEILSHYIAKYGSQEPLAVPLDEGFNRLAWFFPY